ncbi:hypothetical protein ACFLX2_00745 [Candidatus Dependentiae bacterium]
MEAIKPLSTLQAFDKQKNEIEQEGIRRSTAEAEKADVILLIYDGSRKLTTSEKEVYLTILKQHKNKTIVIRNKIDLGCLGNQLSDHHEIPFSCKEKRNNQPLEHAIEKKDSQPL